MKKVVDSTFAMFFCPGHGEKTPQTVGNSGKQDK